MADGGPPAVPADAIELAGQAVSVLGPDGEFEYVNEAFAELTGYGAAQIVGRPWGVLYPDRDVSRVAETVDIEAADGTWNGESVWQHADGDLLVVDHSLSRTGDGRTLCVAQRPTNWTGTGQPDPSESDALDGIERAVDGPYACLDPGGRLVEWNDELKAVTGYDDAALDHRRATDLVASADVDRATSAVATAMRSGRGAVEVDLETAGGTTLPYELVTTRVTEAGSPTGVVLVGRKIQAQRDVRPELASADAALADLLDLGSRLGLTFEERLNAGLALGRDRLDLSYGFLTRIAGDVQEVVVAQGDHELLQAGESCPLTKAYCRKTIREETLLGVHDAVAAGWEDDRAYQTFDLGSYIGGKVIVDGSLYGTICFADTDPRAEAFSADERSFVEALCSWMAEEMSQAVDRESVGDQHERMEAFASMAAHDLRGPLSVAHGNLALAADETDSEYVDEAADAIDRMDDLISDMLSLARSGGSVDDPERVALRRVAETAWETVGTASGRLSIERDLTLRADRDRLLQLLENLFRNAVEHGGDDVAVRVGGFDGGFYVADDGPGIPEEERTRVFERGFTTDDDGSGLGLSIVNSIAGAHGWRATVGESGDGGARFEFDHVDVPTVGSGDPTDPGTDGKSAG